GDPALTDQPDLLGEGAIDDGDLRPAVEHGVDRLALDGHGDEKAALREQLEIQPPAIRAAGIEANHLHSRRSGEDGVVQRRVHRQSVDYNVAVVIIVAVIHRLMEGHAHAVDPAPIGIEDGSALARRTDAHAAQGAVHAIDEQLVELTPGISPYGHTGPPVHILSRAYSGTDRKSTRLNSSHV